MAATSKKTDVHGHLYLNVFENRNFFTFIMKEGLASSVIECLCKQLYDQKGLLRKDVSELMENVEVYKHVVLQN